MQRVALACARDRGFFLACRPRLRQWPRRRRSRNRRRNRRRRRRRRNRRRPIRRRRRRRRDSEWGVGRTNPSESRFFAAILQNTRCWRNWFDIGKSQKIHRFEQSPPSTLTSLRPLQQIPPRPRDFDSKFPSALWDIKRRAALVGYSAGPLAGCSGGILGGSAGGLLWRDTRRDTRRDPPALAGYSAGSTGKPLWRNTGRDPLASSSGGILGGIRSCSGGILGGIHWRAALAGYWVGAWCRSIANADSNMKSNNPFLLGGENHRALGELSLAPWARDLMAALFRGAPPIQWLSAPSALGDAIQRIQGVASFRAFRG